MQINGLIITGYRESTNNLTTTYIHQEKSKNAYLTTFQFKEESLNLNF